MNIITPKNWKELDSVFTTTLEAYNKIQEQLFSQSNDVLDIVLASEEGSGIIEDAIKKHPTFVPNMMELKTIVKQLDICQKLMNDQEWLEKQPEYFENPNDTDDDSSSGSGLSILNLYHCYEALGNMVTAMNLDLNMIFKMTYDLRHNMTHFVDREAIKNKVKEIQKSLSQNKNKTRTSTQDIDKVKQMSSHSHGAMGRK